MQKKKKNALNSTKAHYSQTNNIFIVFSVKNHIIVFQEYSDLIFIRNVILIFIHSCIYCSDMWNLLVYQHYLIYFDMGKAFLKKTTDKSLKM